MESDESYVSGFSSPNLIRGRMRGYELHATNKRVIGVKNRKIGAGWLLGAGAGGAVGGAVAATMGKNQLEITLQELEAKKDFEVWKNQISGIEIKQPSWIRTGYLQFNTITGEPVKVKIGDKQAFEQTQTFIESFYPGKLKLVQ